MDHNKYIVLYFLRYPVFGTRDFLSFFFWQLVPGTNCKKRSFFFNFFSLIFRVWYRVKCPIFCLFDFFLIFETIFTKFWTVNPVPNPKYKAKKENKKLASCSWCLVLVSITKNKKMTTNLCYQIRGFPVCVIYFSKIYKFLLGEEFLKHHAQFFRDMRSFS